MGAGDGISDAGGWRGVMGTGGSACISPPVLVVGDPVGTGGGSG